MKARVCVQTGDIRADARVPSLSISCTFNTFKVIEFKADISADALTKKLTKLGMSPVVEMGRADGVSTRVAPKFRFLGLSYEWANEFEKNGVRWVRAKINLRYRLYDCVNMIPRLPPRSSISELDISKFMSLVTTRVGEDLPLTADYVCLFFKESSMDIIHKSINYRAVELAMTCISNVLGISIGLVTKSFGFRFMLLPNKNNFISCCELYTSVGKGV